ncbi:MAG: peptidoglycan DD-metalloendopeptidase family protein [Spartobacteria bacterium]
MVRTACLTFLCGFGFVSLATAQEIDLGRKATPKYPKAEAVTPAQPKGEMHVEKAIAVQPAKSEPVKKPATVASTLPAPRKEITSAVAPTKKPVAEVSPATPIKQAVANPPVVAKKPATVVTAPTNTAAPVKKVEKESPIVATNTARSTSLSAVAPTVKPEVAPVKVASTTSTVAQILKNEPAIKAPPAFVSKSKLEAMSVHPPAKLSLETQPSPMQTISFQGDSAFIKLADGFDFPIGKPDAQGYYKARGFRSRGHLGEDWDGVGGGDTDLGDAIYSIGDGVVVFARDVHMGWGNCVIVRHSYREGGTVKNIDALYGHLNAMLVRKGQAISRGQKIATMGNVHGLYDAHLHLEIRKNLEIGMSRAAFARDFSNYYDPSQFIASHRHLQTTGGTYRVALNTFTRDAKINFDKARNYSHSHDKGGTGESATALKKTLAAKP